ncbi:conserved Plasmodium protein, unknown function [Plasmodium knowlesi strain H]|uniref:Uncharacterized protein n=3 Tax=Plasmodium knowlesi TaxID=5850 RepID=A0A5K1UYV1_PLAKH|nr:conserved Plasmodium protein, unknown function [Plasmodium knowlesi strain H]OTN64014.1 Uncharacterized protein PKNOH_S140262000 [Plasmodium knowlesi]CAA9991035.1 conserved Plasmodium protein, unknown function [Plasmodium knowlesi strain H]SBO20684.1 conserved Plasmodium protein, unknown function [Plasmodium knowlesi strain H]SBO21114.1 conserved Plasmodium protein, unknown function [Plasmodium knowlesi strain H]VVS80509.1 conserved Plasmodium protein, unknown function [Plasmodium knowlesi |eukprot:XP_002262317.1 hypothetical protein, conserved in Plasmodium species [Plasmodium knowlesi strain H]
MKGKGISTDAPKEERTTKRAKAKKTTKCAKGKAQRNKKRKQGKTLKGKEPSSDESDVYFYNDLRRWQNNVKVPIWLKKPKDKESIKEFYKNVIKKLLRVKNKIRAYKIEEAYLIDCLRKCLMDLNLNSIRYLDYVNYEMFRRPRAGECSDLLKNDAKDEEKGKCSNHTKEEVVPVGTQEDIAKEFPLKDDNYADETTHIRVDCPTGKLTPPTAEEITCLIESLKKALSVEQKDKKEDLMRHVFNKVIIPGAFFENNNFCPIFMNLLKLDIYNSCCLSGTEMSPQLMNLIQLLNNFDEGVADAPSTGKKQKDLPSSSSASTPKGDVQNADAKQKDAKQADSQQADAQQADAPPANSQRVGKHHNESEDNSYREDRLFFQSQTSLFKLSQYCIEKGIVENQQVASFDTIYIYNGKEYQCGSYKCKNKKKRLLSHGNLKYSLDVTEKKNESLHFINEKRVILENDSTLRNRTNCDSLYEEDLNHAHVKRQYVEDVTPVKVGKEVEEGLANESVPSVKAKETSCGREVLEILSNSDEKEQLQYGQLAPVEKETISSVEASMNETDQSFVSAVSVVKGTNKFDYGGCFPQACTNEGCKEDPNNYLRDDMLKLDEGGNATGGEGLDEEFLHGGDTNMFGTPRKATAPTGTETFRLYKENGPEGNGQNVELPLQVVKPGIKNTESNIKIRKRKVSDSSHSDHSSPDKSQSFLFNTYELFMENGKIKKNKKLNSSNEFEDLPIEGKSSTEESHDSKGSNFTGAQVRFQLESNEVGWDSSLNRNHHIISSSEKDLPTSPFPSSRHSQACHDSDMSVIVEKINYDREKDFGSGGREINTMEIFSPSRTRTKCIPNLLSDFSVEKKGYADERDKNVTCAMGRFCNDTSVNCIIDMHDYLKGDGSECLPPKVISHSEVIVLEDNDEEGNEDNTGGSVDRGNYDSVRNCEDTPQTDKRTPWMNTPRINELDLSIPAETPKTKETESKKELSILNIDINKMNNVVLEELMEFFGLKSKTLSRKTLITELTRIQSYLNEQFEKMAKEYHLPISTQKDPPKLSKAKSIEKGYSADCSTYRDREEKQKRTIWNNGCSSSVSHSMGVPLANDLNAEVQRFFQNEEWFDGSLVGGGSTDHVSTTQMISNEVSTTQKSPHPLNDDQAKSQEDYLNHMKKKIKQMELKLLFERIDEAIGVNEVLHDHIKREKEIEYSLLKKYLVDCKLSVNREIVMSYCKDKDIQVVLKKKTKV